MKANIRKLNGGLTITLLYHKVICTPSQGKQNLEDTFLTFLLYILTPKHLILMKVAYRRQIPLLSCALISMTQAIVKTGKLAPFLTHLYYIHQILNRTVKVRTLRLLQTYVIRIVPIKHVSQPRALKLRLNLCNNHRRGKVTTLRRLKLTILPSRITRKTSLVFLEVVNTTCSLIMILITHKNTVFDACKNSFSPFLCVILSLSLSLSLCLLVFISFLSAHTSFSSFQFWGQIFLNTKQKENLNNNNTTYIFNILLY